MLQLTVTQNQHFNRTCNVTTAQYVKVVYWKYVGFLVIFSFVYKMFYTLYVLFFYPSAILICISVLLSFGGTSYIDRSPSAAEHRFNRLLS